MRRRAVWLVMTAIVGSLMVSAQASAAARAFAPRFSTNDTGNIAMVANTLLTCPDTDANCPAARAGTASGAALNNNAYVMRYVNADPAAPPGVFDASSADLSLPAARRLLDQ